MRFVKTAPGKDLHNLHPVQHKKKIYYKVIKVSAIPSRRYSAGRAIVLPLLNSLVLNASSEGQWFYGSYSVPVKVNVV